MSSSDDLRTAIRWLPMHAVTRAILAVSQRYPFAQIMAGPHRAGDLHPLMDGMREDVVVTPFISMTASHELCRAILRDDRFASPSPTRIAPAPIAWLLRQTDLRLPSPVEPPSMLAVDGEQHSRYRKAVASAFTPRAVQKLRERTEEITARLLDRLPAQPDLIADFAAPLPVAIISAILGVDDDQGTRLWRLGQTAAPLLDFGLNWRSYRDANAALRETDDMIREHVARLRENPGEDIFSQVVTTGGFTARELSSLGALLAGAGFETTISLLGNAVVTLSEHPTQLALLREDPTQWPNAIEEVLRYESPIRNLIRTAVEPATVCGRRFTEGQSVALLIGGANRDPAVFTDPHTFDIGRPNAREHLAFGSGVHGCLGQSLARMEAGVALPALFDRYEVTLGTPTRRPLATLNGYAHIPTICLPAE